LVACQRSPLTCVAFLFAIRILSHHIKTRFLDPSPLRISEALRAARQAIFPNNGPAPPRVVPDGDEVLEIRNRAARAIVAVVPERAWGLYLGSKGPSDRGGSQEKQEKEKYWVAEVEAWLDVVGDPYLNRHLMIRLVELLVVRVIPEMAEDGVDTLLSDRVGAL
jgi:hypothetical protein